MRMNSLDQGRDLDLDQLLLLAVQICIILNLKLGAAQNQSLDRSLNNPVLD